MRARVAVLAVLVAAAGGVAACGGDDGDEGTSAATPPEGCREVEAPPPKEVDLKRPDLDAPLPARLTAVVSTSCGEFEIALDTRRSPKTVASFVHLADEDVYDQTAFHRIVPGFLIQGGDPEGDGFGGPGYYVDEPPSPDTVYRRGVVAMAKTTAEPPGRSGSQFFIVTAADAGPADSAVLGRVTAGQDVIARIEEAGDPASGDEGVPASVVVIDDVRIREG